MASLFKDQAKLSAYRDRRFRGNQEEYEHALLTSTTVYIGNMSFYTTEEQVYELFSRAGEIKKIVMGLDKSNKTPCGFCFVMYYSREDTEDSVKYISGTVLDDRPIRVDFDWGFEEGRQWGRGRSGGQVRDEYRTNYDPGRGGYGKLVQKELEAQRDLVDYGTGSLGDFDPHTSSYDKNGRGRGGYGPPRSDGRDRKRYRDLSSNSPTMRPQLHLFLLPISTLLLLHPATSLCVPRNTTSYIVHAAQPLAPTAAPSIKSPAPTPATKPPSPSPHPQSTPPTAPVLPSGNAYSMSAGDDSQSATGSDETATAKSLCGQTSFSAICLSSVQILLPTVTGPIDTKTMLILQAKALKLRTASSQALATKLATHPNTDKSYASSYQSAADFLGQAIDNIDQGLDAVTSDDMDTAHSMFDAICTNYSDVENEFMDWDEPSALDGDLNDFDHMSANILDLLHGLK